MENKEEIDAWKKSVGIHLMQRPSEDALEKALKSEGKHLSQAEHMEVEDTMLALANYYCFLQTQIGETSAKVNYLTEILDRQTNAYAAKCGGGGHFLERKAMGVINNKDICKVSDSLALVKAKYDMLKPMADGVRNKLESIKKIHDRRIRGLR